MQDWLQALLLSALTSAIYVLVGQLFAPKWFEATKKKKTALLLAGAGFLLGIATGMLAWHVVSNVFYAISGAVIGVSTIYASFTDIQYRRLSKSFQRIGYLLGIVSLVGMWLTGYVQDMVSVWTIGGTIGIGVGLALVLFLYALFSKKPLEKGFGMGDIRHMILLSIAVAPLGFLGIIWVIIGGGFLFFLRIVFAVAFQGGVKQFKSARSFGQYMQTGAMLALLQALVSGGPVLG